MSEGQKRFLTRQDVLAAKDITVEEVEIPEWGGSGAVLGCRVMGVLQKEKFIKRIRKERPTTDENGKPAKEYYIELEGSGALLFIETACDADGNLLFTEKDYEALNKKSAAAMKRFTDKAELLNGLNEGAVKAAEAAKNASASQEAVTTSASNTGSQPTSDEPEKSLQPALT